MDFFVGLIIGILVCFVIGNAALKILMMRQDDEIDEAVRESLKRLKDIIIPSRLELVNNSIYLYHKDTGEFLGQGKTMQELNDTVKARFPNKLFNVPQEELDKVKDKVNE